MAKIKICGLMRMEDVEAVNEYLPDYIGFIFAPSRRRLTVAQAQQLAAALDKRIKRVGVFVNEAPDVVEQTRRAAGLDVVQLYQDAPGQAPVGKVWRGMRVKDEESVAAIQKIHADAFVLDAYSKQAYGGTGETFNWQLAQQAATKKRIVLAGGLEPGNVCEAIRQVRPFAVDVSSGVESGGQKDADKIRAFIENARSMA